ncbi:MAG: hypothetical protein R2712_27960 [Vicinamibacterales bacterium]
MPYPQFYGLAGRDVRLNFTFDYKIQRATRRFEVLLPLPRAHRHGRPRHPVSRRCNDQTDATSWTSLGRCCKIDAPTVERYTAPARTGEYPRKYDLPDQLKYAGPTSSSTSTKIDEPDPDTGTTSASSAGHIQDDRLGQVALALVLTCRPGPESWTNNWIVDDDQSRCPHAADLGVRRRVPGRLQLGSDLGYVARFVAINLLFTTSPRSMTHAEHRSPEAGASKVARNDAQGRPGIERYSTSSTRSSRAASCGASSPTTAGRSAPPIPTPSTMAPRALALFSGNLFESDCWVGFRDALRAAVLLFRLEPVHLRPRLRSG